MAIRLTNADLEVVITPERGADITELIDRRTGIQVLAESPTRKVSSSSTGWGESIVHWMNGYPGGWQVLIPNAGPARDHEGVTQGFHGEASLATWTVVSETSTALELETFLLTAPLHLERKIVLSASTLRVTDTVTNLSPGPTEFRFCQHPAFGHHFLDDASYLRTEANIFLADGENPGQLAKPNALGAPTEVLPEGPERGSVAIPGPGSAISLFGALTDFPTNREQGSLTTAAFVSPRKDLIAELTWDTKIFPHAWFWVEAHAMPGWPWFRRLYSVAVEPSNVLPGEGLAGGGLERGGGGTSLLPGASLCSEITIELSSF